jgi:hypothetical protein
VTYDDMDELYNQTSIYIGKTDFKLNFWDTQPFLKSLQPNWKKWQKVWKIRIKYYTPRTKPQQPDVDVAGIVEKWNTKRKANESQIATISVSPMFGPDIVDLYTQCNESYNPTAPIKTADAAASLRKLVALDIKFMVGCDCEWNFDDDGGSPGPAAAAGPASGGPLLPPAAAGDDAAVPHPAPTSAAIDTHDFTKWDLTNLPSIPLGEQQFDEGNITSHRCWHAALLLVLLSDDIERLHPDVARTLHAGYQTKFLRPVDVADLKKYPSVGPGAYTPEEVNWCDATYDFLLSQMDDDARIKRGLPRRRARGGRAAAAAPSAAAPAPALPPTAAAAAAGNNDTENEDDIPLVQRKNHKRRRTSR